MKTVFSRQSLLYSGLLTFVLILVLTACGANTTTGGAVVVSTPQPAKSVADTTTGCPNGAVTNANVTSAKPNVVIESTQANTTVTAHNGDMIEIRFPFGQKWTGPTTSQGVLELQTPPGYASQSDNACIWRFIAKGTGTTTLTFSGQAICKKGEMCALYISQMPFTINVK